jgi:hypothetical protein
MELNSRAIKAYQQKKRMSVPKLSLLSTHLSFSIPVMRILLSFGRILARFTMHVDSACCSQSTANSLACPCLLTPLSHLGSLLFVAYHLGEYYHLEQANCGISVQSPIFLALLCLSLVLTRSWLSWQASPLPMNPSLPASWAHPSPHSHLKMSSPISSMKKVVERDGLSVVLYSHFLSLYELCDSTTSDNPSLNCNFPKFSSLTAGLCCKMLDISLRCQL